MHKIKYVNIFAVKSVRSFCVAKAPYSFWQKLAVSLLTVHLKFKVLLPNKVISI